MTSQRTRSLFNGLATLAAALSAATLGCDGAPTGDGESNEIQSRALVTSEVAPPPVQAPTIILATGALRIVGTEGGDVVTVYGTDPITVTTNRGLFRQSYPASAVRTIVFLGEGGNDSFSNGTSIPCVAQGGDGDDFLAGGSGDDSLYGNDGDDILYGNDGDDFLVGGAGADRLYGFDGDDILKGEAGNDELHGGPGRDALYGGTGSDQLFGDDGSDVLVSIGGGADTLTGGNQLDNYWMDPDDVLTDASSNETALGDVHKVAAFEGVSYDGGDTFTAVDKVLDGPNLPDPRPGSSDMTRENYGPYPLFGSGGPKETDIHQGGVGDCYLLAVLAATAKQNPEAIRRMVVDLGDRTFAVRFFDGVHPRYVRVDADLWEQGTSIVYAQIVNHALWVPIVEKAYAFFRRQEGTYASLASGDGTLDEQMNATNTDRFDIPDDILHSTIIGEDANGTLDGTLKATIDDGVRDLLNWIIDRQAKGKAVYTGAFSSVSDDTPLSEEWYRRGQHVFAVDHVEVNGQGQPIGLFLYNPYGYVQPLYDFTRIFFFVGRAVVWDM